MAVIRIGFNPDFAPFAVFEKGLPTGITIERTVQVLEGAGIEATFIPEALPHMEKQLLAGVFDALAGVAATPDRADRLSYSKPLMITGGAWFVLAGTEWPADDALAQSAPGRRRVVTPLAGPLAAVIRKRYPNLAIDACTDYGDALAAVVRSKADAAALNWQVGCMQVERDHPGRFALPDTPFIQIPLALAVPIGDPTGLLASVDPHIPDDWGRLPVGQSK